MPPAFGAVSVSGDARPRACALRRCRLARRAAARRSFSAALARSTCFACESLSDILSPGAQTGKPPAATRHRRNGLRGQDGQTGARSKAGAAGEFPAQPACHACPPMAQGAHRDSAPHILRSQPDNCCGSSVAEHSLGKGEVESSILSHSTSQINELGDIKLPRVA